MSHEAIKKVNVYFAVSDFPSWYCIQNIAKRVILENANEAILVASVYYAKDTYLDCVLVNGEVQFIGGTDFSPSEEFDSVVFNKLIENSAVIRLPDIDRGQNIVHFSEMDVGDVFDFTGSLYTKKSRYHAEDENGNVIDFESHFKMVLVKKKRQLMDILPDPQPHQVNSYIHDGKSTGTGFGDFNLGDGDGTGNADDCCYGCDGTGNGNGFGCGLDDGDGNMYHI